MSGTLVVAIGIRSARSVAGSIDLAAGLIYRGGSLRPRSRKRQTPVPIPRRLRRHLAWLARVSPAPPRRSTAGATCGLGAR